VSDWNRFDLQPDRLRLYGSLQHWSTWYDKPLPGCIFHDLHYQSHTGHDFPVNEGMLVHTTMGGEVVWAGSNNPRGNLVVFENNDYQVWLAHLSSITVSKGYILHYREIFGLSRNAGNSKGARLPFASSRKPVRTFTSCLTRNCFVAMMNTSTLVSQADP